MWNIVARCEPFAPRMNDKPVTLMAWAIPLVCIATSVAFAATASVCSIEEESGSWIAVKRYPWSWAGNETGRNLAETPHRQIQQAPVNQQHQHAHSQQLADDGQVSGGLRS